VGTEKLTFVTLVMKAPFEPKWPYWLPEGLAVQDLKVRTSPWAIQEIFRPTGSSGELVIETSLDVAGKPSPVENTRPVAVRGGTGACIQGSWDEGGQPEADSVTLTWHEVDYSYTIRQTSLGLSCEDLVKIAGP
jgi:hypothetical protein